jgi:hypothetical protein
LLSDLKPKNSHSKNPTMMPSPLVDFIALSNERKVKELTGAT